MDGERRRFAALTHGRSRPVGEGERLVWGVREAQGHVQLELRSVFSTLGEGRQTMECLSRARTLAERLNVRRIGLALAGLAILAGCENAGFGSSSRYAAEHFRTTRTNFVYVRDKVTGQWVNRRCELRAPVARPLPEPLTTSEDGDRLSVQLFDHESVRSAGIRSVHPETRDGFRVWVIENVLRADDVAGRTRYGVSVSWPQRDQPTHHDPLELFYLPRLGNEVPGEWSPWVVASATREGALGWWSEAHGAPPAPPQPIAHPFELRCQVVTTDTPGVVR